MRKSKLQIIEQITLNIAVAAIVVVSVATGTTRLAPAPAAPAPSPAPSAAARHHLARHHPAPAVARAARHTPSPTPVAQVVSVTPSPLPSPATNPSPSPSPEPTKYPGLPDVPHPQYEYHSLTIPSGPLYPMEPFLDRIQAPAGWDATAASSSNPAPTIAVIDTGFALNHEDLTGRWATNPNETAGSTTDADGNGYAGDWRGWDFVHNDSDPMAGQDSPTAGSATHGTLTAGLAGLLNPNAKILPLQVLDDTGSGYTDDVAAAIHYAADRGVKVISLSLGSTSDDQYMHDQVDYAISKGVVVVAAAGNDGCNCMLYPAAYPEVLAVGASNPDDTKASFSSYGPNLDVVAPGTANDVCSSQYTSTNATNAYSCAYAGTSFATPIVAGLAAVLSQQCPACSNVDINTSIELGAGSQRTDTLGYGRINMNNAVTLITQQSTRSVTTGSADLNNDGLINIVDLSILLSHYGAPGAGDINGDGIVDYLDLSALLSRWTG